MRNPGKMLALLEEMRTTPSGQRIVAPGRFGLSEEEQEEQHHASLLVDAGLADWTGPGQTILRITNEGHELMEALERGPEWREKLYGLLRGGKILAEAVETVVRLASTGT